ncbi:MAG TPA: SIR2 family protein, partial [Terriglobales bacterium]
TERMPRRLPDVYLRFAEALQAEDYVLTFNYDVLLETALEKVGKPYRLFPSRYKSVDRRAAIVDDTRQEAIVIKLHGSVDWFSRTEYRQLEEDRIAQGFQTSHDDLVFGPKSDIRTAPLVDGPRFENDPLKDIYRVVNPERLYSKPLLFLATPVLLNPSSAKIVYAHQLEDFWWGLGQVGVLNFGMAVIGFSMPLQDEYARQVIYRLATNYQNHYWGEKALEHQKTPLLLVDLKKSAEEISALESRYAFLDRARTVTYFGGFNEHAVEMFRS